MSKFFSSLTKGFAVAGIGALVIAIALVAVDIIWRRLFSGTSSGTVDLTQLCVMAAAFWSIPYAFSKNAHVSVDLLNSIFPDTLQRIFDILAGIIALLSLGFVLYLSWGRALEQHSYGDTSLDLAIPMIYYWFFLLSGCLLSCLTLFFQILEDGISLIKL